MPVHPLSLQEKDLFKICQTVTQLAEGRSNATGTVTLSTATATTVSAPTCGTSSVVKLSPMTANAAAAVATTFILSTDIMPSSFVISHASSTTTDRTFGWIAVG